MTDSERLKKLAAWCAPVLNTDDLVFIGRCCAALEAQAGQEGEIARLRASLREMRDACACAMRSMDADTSVLFLEELEAAGVPDGFGVRANALLSRAGAVEGGE